MHVGRAQKIAFVLGLSLLLLSQVPSALAQESVGQAQAEISTINRELDEAINRYNEIILSIERLNDEIEAREREIDTLRHQMSQSSQTLNKRLAGMYKHGQVSLLEVLLGSRSVDDFTQRLNLLSRVTYSDIELLRRVGEKRRALEGSRNQLQKSKDEQTQLLADLAEMKYQIENQLKEKQTILANLQAEESAKAAAPPPPAQPIPNPHLTRSAEGIATWYVYTGGYTAAHNTLPLGTKVLVTNLSNGRQVWVEIVDRGIAGSAIIDLEKVAFAQLANPSQGVVYVRIEW